MHHMEIFILKLFFDTEAIFHLHVSPFFPFYVQIRAIEDEIDLGQIEEVILIAQDELGLVDYYNGTLHIVY